MGFKSVTEAFNQNDEIECDDDKIVILTCGCAASNVEDYFKPCYFAQNQEITTTVG